LSNNKIKSSKKQDLVTNFFDGYVEDFFSIYDNQSFFPKIWNNFVRRSMYKRFSISRNIILESGANSLLDVGCGTGLHTIQLCVNDDLNVVGIDIAENMIAKAKELYSHAKEHTATCDFVVADFNSVDFESNYDAILSLGTLEYIDDIYLFLNKMIQITNKVIVVSLPVKWHILTPQRIIRYWLRNCPLYFYSKSTIRKIANKIGIKDYIIIDLGRDYLLIINT